jgi:hypothetical protein
LKQSIIMGGDRADTETEAKASIEATREVSIFMN